MGLSSIISLSKNATGQWKILENLLDSSTARLLEGLGPGTQDTRTQEACLPGCCAASPWVVLLPCISWPALFFSPCSWSAEGSPSSNLLIQNPDSWGRESIWSSLSLRSIPGVRVIDRGPGLRVLKHGSWIPSEQVIQEEDKGNCSTFNDSASEARYHDVYKILWVTQASLFNMGVD